MRLSYRRRKSLHERDFVFPKGTKSAPGVPGFPITNKAHAKAALSRAAQKKVRLTRAERCRVVKAVCSRRKFSHIAICRGESNSKRLSSCPVPKK